MAQIQFLNGSRDSEIQDLVDEASLNLGSAEGTYITIKDDAILPAHALVYSVGGQYYVKPETPQAKCFVNFRPLPEAGQGVQDRDILMFGRTLVKFWRSQAPAAGGGGAAAPDPAVARERDALRGQVADLQRQVQQAGAGASAAAQAQIDAARREKDEAQKQLEAARRDLKKEQESSSQARSDADRLRGELEGKLRATTDERDSARRSDEKTKGELAHEKKRAEAAEARAGSAEKRADAAEAEVAKAQPELAKKDQELGALREALEALRAKDAVARRDRRAALREGSDLAKALAALAVPDVVRDRVAAAVQDEVDREVLSRDGTVVPLRGLRCPGCELDLEAELSALKTRRRQADALRALGARDLTAEQVAALIARIRSREPVRV